MYPSLSRLYPNLIQIVFKLFGEGTPAWIIQIRFSKHSYGYYKGKIISVKETLKELTG